MNRKQAQVLAEKLFNAELQRIAVDANLHDFHGATYPHAIKAAKYRQDLLAAMNILFGDKRQLDMFDDRT